MAQHNFVKLEAQGRAYDATRAWTEQELESLLTLERECDIDRKVAALYIRNGITTKAGYDVAQKAGFVPKSLEDLRTEAIVEHQKVVLANLGLNEEVTEPTEVVETEEVADDAPTEEVTEPTEVDEPEEVADDAPTEEVTEPTEVDEPEADPKEKKSKGKGGK